MRVLTDATPPMDDPIATMPEASPRRRRNQWLSTESAGRKSWIDERVASGSERTRPSPSPIATLERSDGLREGGDGPLRQHDFGICRRQSAHRPMQRTCPRRREREEPAGRISEVSLSRRRAGGRSPSRRWSTAGTSQSRTRRRQERRARIEDCRNELSRLEVARTRVGGRRSS